MLRFFCKERSLMAKSGSSLNCKAANPAASERPFTTLDLASLFAALHAVFERAKQQAQQS
jgi:hypothetical protein